MARYLRIALLLILLAVVALSAWRAKQRTTRWAQPLSVVVYPLNGDGSPVSARYISGLQSVNFEDMGRFLDDEARRYGRQVFRTMNLSLAPSPETLPPPIPQGGAPWEVLLWSLHLRSWAWWHDTWKGARPDIRLFIQYYDPAQHLSLDHSTGLEKGQIAVIKAFASTQYARSNQVVIIHELLHTLGATDKYDPATLLPRYPEGYAEPQAQPRYPQQWAEIMGGRIPMSTTSAAIPTNLQRTLIGPATAAEIGLTRPRKPKE